MLPGWVDGPAKSAIVAFVTAFSDEARHPGPGPAHTDCGYAPMIELLRFLEVNGFTNYIVSGGGLHAPGR